MGDKNPKTNKKQADQKQSKTNSADIKKKNDAAAKQVDKSKK